jgi:uncharacterized protein with von Willebrand factor type A (vWA) domain
MAQRRSHWLEADSYDRHTLQRLKTESPSLRALEESGNRLLPHFDGFLLDLFALLFKMNIVFRAPDTVLPSAAFYRLLLEQLAALPPTETLRQQTVLDETRAGLATLMLGERLLQLLKSERILARGDMLDFWSLEHQEREVAVAEAHTRTALALQEKATTETQRQLGDLAERLRREAELPRRRLQQKTEQIRRTVRESLERERNRIEAQPLQVLDRLDQSSSETERWGQQLGNGGQMSPGARIELGKRLANNRKLKKLAQMVGRMRTQALALRRKLFERANAEVYEVGVGGELSRLLPQELLALRHPILRRDFQRRFVEASLFQYTLRAVERKGKGPLVVCLDGSSSMAGDKELWSKAVSLTLLEIAQRQRRLFRSICFASAETPLQILDMNRRTHYAADMQRVFDLAEYFPGGGTDFHRPLDAAAKCVQQTAHRRGDIVFITDGECRVDDRWLQEFKRNKERLGFSVFSVLIDVGAASSGAVKEFSDRITTVTRLTSDAGSELFVEI